MNKELLKKILETKTMQFSVEEVENLLDEELNKEPEEMDTDLVELCIEALSKAEKESESGEEKTDSAEENKTDKENIKKIKSVKKFFLIAAIVTVLSLISVSVSANVFKVDLPFGIARIFENYILINLSKIKSADLDDALRKVGIENACIFPIFYEDNCFIKEIKRDDEQDFVLISFEFKDSDINGYISVYEDNAYDSILEILRLYSDLEQLKQITVDGIDCIISSSADSEFFVFYSVDNLNYVVKFNNTSYNEIVDNLLK